MKEIKRDINGKVLNVGDKVHPVGKGNKPRYIIELGDKTAGISADKNSTSCYGVMYEKLVKYKDQS